MLSPVEDEGVWWKWEAARGDGGRKGKLMVVSIVEDEQGYAWSVSSRGKGRSASSTIA